MLSVKWAYFGTQYLVLHPLPVPFLDAVLLLILVLLWIGLRKRLQPAVHGSRFTEVESHHTE